MAESIAEAEKEVKEGKNDLTEQVAKLEAETKEQAPKDEEDKLQSKEQKKLLNAQTENMVDDALSSQSVIKYDGHDTSVKTNDAMAETD